MSPGGRPRVPDPDKRTVRIKITPNERDAVKKQQAAEKNKDSLGKYLVDKTLKK